MDDARIAALTAIIPTDEYLDELRKRVCGDPDQLARFDQYVNMVAELEEKIELGESQEEIDALAKQIRNVQDDLDREEGIAE
jgi:polyhydroxyalkanoate synthesis regulator phasin